MHELLGLALKAAQATGINTLGLPVALEVVKDEKKHECVIVVYYDVLGSQAKVDAAVWEKAKERGIGVPGMGKEPVRLTGRYESICSGIINGTLIPESRAFAYGDSNAIESYLDRMLESPYKWLDLSSVLPSITRWSPGIVKTAVDDGVDVDVKIMVFLTNVRGGGYETSLAIEPTKREQTPNDTAPTR